MTSFVVVQTLIQRCLDVAMRRNNVVFRRRINTSIATVSRRHSDIGIQRWNDVDTTSLCLLGSSLYGIAQFSIFFRLIPKLILFWRLWIFTDRKRWRHRSRDTKGLPQKAHLGFWNFLVVWLSLNKEIKGYAIW